MPERLRKLDSVEKRGNGIINLDSIETPTFTTRNNTIATMENFCWGVSSERFLFSSEEHA